MERIAMASFASTTITALLLATLSSGADATFCDLEALRSLGETASNGRSVATPVVHALRLDHESIKVDGKLSDEAWERAEAAWGFRLWEPTRGGVPGEETVFKVAYDDLALYVGVACLVTDPSEVRGQLCRRDDLHDSDVVSLYLDAFHDRTTGYNFRVNAAGVKGDRYVYNDGDMDPDWDAVWDAEVSSDDAGWYVEYRIPFSCVKYKESDQMTWGCNLWRYTHRRGEESAWTVWRTDTRGFVSRFGEITGLDLIPPARQLEIMPYAVTSLTDAPDPESAGKVGQTGNFGLDVKYGVTPNFTLNTTIQPDFGQVEADPAVLNLSPFETYYEEKRPFFVQGNRFFEHPDFNVFYSRRIGTGEENARIRGAAKLTGKTAGGLSLAALYASTDVAGNGREHQLFVTGERPAHYFVSRVGREFSMGAHRVNFIQTAVLRSADRALYGDYASRDAFTSAVDFDLNFHDKDYNVKGSFVGSTIDHAASSEEGGSSREATYGTGGHISASKAGGAFTGGVSGDWKTRDLDLNDVGFLSASDEEGVGAWVGYQHHADSDDAAVLSADAGLSVSRSWIYAEGRGYDRDTGREAWSYASGHSLSSVVELSGSAQFRSFWHAWAGLGRESESTSKYSTRTFDGAQGPPMRFPPSVWSWLGFSTDYRKPVSFEVNLNASGNERGAWSRGASVEAGWAATRTTRYGIEVSYSRSHGEAQHLDNFPNPGGGIGGVSYVFAELEQQTVDATFRADVLFSRDLSLQLYAQPYLTVGDYHNPRELIRADSYDLAPPAGIPGFPADSVDDYDFNYASVNVNAVLRWEYMPGSTFYLVWKQGRDVYEDRLGSPSLKTELDPSRLFEDEPVNELLAKVTYWLPI